MIDLSYNKMTSILMVGVFISLVTRPLDSLPAFTCKPCKNNGLLYDKVNCICNCPEYFSGKQCEIQNSLPIKDNGEITDKIKLSEEKYKRTYQRTNTKNQSSFTPEKMRELKIYRATMTLNKMIKEKRKQLRLGYLKSVYEEARANEVKALRQYAVKKKDLDKYIKKILTESKDLNTLIQHPVNHNESPKTNNTVSDTKNGSKMNSFTRKIANRRKRKINKKSELARLYSRTTRRLNPEVGDEFFIGKNDLKPNTNQDSDIKDNNNNYKNNDNLRRQKTMDDNPPPNYQHYDMVFDSDTDPNLSSLPIDDRSFDPNRVTTITPPVEPDFLDVTSVETPSPAPVDTDSDNSDLHSTDEDDRAVESRFKRIPSQTNDPKYAGNRVNAVMKKIIASRRRKFSDNYRRRRANGDIFKQANTGGVKLAQKKHVHPKLHRYQVRGEGRRRKRFSNVYGGIHHSSNETPVDDAIVDLDDDTKGATQAGYLPHSQHTGQQLNEEGGPLDYITNQGEKRETRVKYSGEDAKEHGIHIRDIGDIAGESVGTSDQDKKADKPIQYYDETAGIRNGDLQDENDLGEEEEDGAREPISDLTEQGDGEDKKVDTGDKRVDISRNRSLSNRSRKHNVIGFLISKKANLTHALIKIIDTIGGEAKKISKEMKRNGSKSVNIIEEFSELMGIVSEEADKINSIIKKHNDNSSDLSENKKDGNLKKSKQSGSFDWLINRLAATVDKVARVRKENKNRKKEVEQSTQKPETIPIKQKSETSKKTSRFYDNSKDYDYLNKESTASKDAIEMNKDYDYKAYEQSIADVVNENND